MNVMTTMRVAVISVSINLDRMNVGVEPGTNLMGKTVLVKPLSFVIALFYEKVLDERFLISLLNIVRQLINCLSQ